MGSRISELHQKGQEQSLLRRAIMNDESITVYVPGEYAKESTTELLLMLAKNVEKDRGSKVDLDYEIEVGVAPGKHGDTIEKSQRRIIVLSGYSRF